MTGTSRKHTHPDNNSKHHDSITEVNRKCNHGLGVWGNPRVVMGVRVDSELKKRFKQVAKRVFGSVCNPIESFMATVVSCAESKVNFGNTVEVGTIVIERNLKERRKLIVEKTKPPATPQVKCDFCGKAPATQVFLHPNSGILKRACSYHAGILKTYSSWKKVDDSTSSISPLILRKEQ